MSNVPKYMYKDMFLYRKVLRDNKQNLPNFSNFSFTQFIYHLVVRMQNCHGKQFEIPQSSKNRITTCSNI